MNTRVLIVEDDLLMAEALSLHLEQLGYQVQGIAPSSEIALAAVANQCPDLVLMDIILQGPLDGIETAQLIREQFDIPILYLTACADQHLFQRAKITEPFAYLLKPFNPRELHLTIEMALYRQRNEKRLREAHDHLEQKVAERTREMQQTNELLQDEIRERQRIAEELRESETRFRTLVEHSPDALFVDIDGKVAYANPAAARLLRIEKPEDLLGLTPRDVVHPDYFATMQQRITNARERGSVNPVIEYQMLRADGSPVEVESLSFPCEFNGKKAAVAWARDISARKAAERQTHRFQTALDSSADAIFLLDVASMRFLDMNDTACNRLGYSRKELLEMGPQHINPYFNRDMLAQRLDEIIASEHKTGRIETWHKCKDDTLLPVEVNLRAIESENGWLMIAIARDISQRLEAERQLRESEERFRQLAENIQGVFWIRDAAIDKIIYASPAFESIWGIPLSELYENPRVFIDAVHAEDKARVIAAFTRQKEQQAWFNEEFRVCHPDGTVRWIWSRAFPVRDEYGTVYRIAGIAEDITRQKQTEFALRQSEETARLLIEHAPVGIALAGRDFKFSSVNQALCEMLGYSAQELYALTFADITHPEHVQIDLAMTRKLFNGEIPTYSTEKRYLRKNSEAIWVHLVATVIRDQDGQPLYGMGFIEDITARREMQAQQLAALEMQRDALVREVHHRIKNNLQGVVGLMRQYATEHTAVAGLVNDIASKIFAVAVVHGLQSRYTTEEIELSDMLGEIGQTVATMLGTTCTPHLNKEAALSARINRNEAVPIALTLNELLVNACKHGQGGSGAPDVSIGWLHDGSTLSIRIGNTLAPEQRDFDFASARGLGTGLTLVKSLLPRQGAALRFYRDEQHITAELQLSAPVIIMDPA